MMRNYLRESLHWLHLLWFKPITLDAELLFETERQRRRVYLKILPVQLATILTFVAFSGVLSEAFGHRFPWSQALILTALIVPFMILLVAAYALGSVTFAALVGAGVAMVVALYIGLSAGPGVGLVFGLATGLVFGLQREVVRLSVALSGGLIVGLVLGLVVGLIAESSSTALRFGTVYATAFLVTYLRPFHLVPYTLQFWRSAKVADPFLLFRNSPVYWDEAIAMPLPFLSDWLARLVTFDRERGMGEIELVGTLPHQRGAAQRAVVRTIVNELRHADTFERMMASAPRVLAILPERMPPELEAHLPKGFTGYVPKGLYDARRYIAGIAELASDYQTRVTSVGQMKVLEELVSALEYFFNAMVLIKRPVGPNFQSAALRWLEIVKAEQVRVRKRLAFEPIPNPFVVGNPLKVRDKNLFKGRKDIIVAIEENIINPAQRPALLLYGRRRIGKTSTLWNLPRLLSSRFIPVFIDCQDAKWREGDGAFCYHLATSIHKALNERAPVGTIGKPQLEQFEQYAFTRLGEYLDHIEEASRAAHKQILLTFDEYEKLEEGISASKITIEVLNQLRNIVQHRDRIVMLFSGGHRFEEMKTINWSDYLINVKTLELSYLPPEAARELITEPVPLLQYESGVIEQIIEMTHCQPYLLQAVASDLVNHLNSERRMLATGADLEVAVEKVLVTAQSYFFYTWRGYCSEAEREVLQMIAIGDANNRTLSERQASLQSLCHKEILERHAGGYRFSIELFRRWVLKNQTSQPFTPGDLPEPAELEYAAS